MCGIAGAFQQPDGKVESVLGPYVEPVQLQVVCYRLWETLNFDDQEINEKDLALVGDVDESLADYYSLSVSRAAQETGVRERTIRDWFETSLITPEGIRAQVLMGAETSEGLDNRAVRYLENAHIIRGEKRAGAAWFELAHDRLIEPVRRSNAGWFGKNLNLFQLQALTWNQQGRSEGLLLRGKELDDARNNMAADQLLTPIETTFLDACLALRRHEQRDSRLRQYIIAGLVASLVFLVMAVIGLYAANNARADAVLSAQAAQTSQADALTQKSEAEKQKTEAEKQARLSLIRQLGSQAVVQAQTDPDLAMLLASEAVNLQGKLGGPIPLEINKDLVTVLTSGPRPLKYLRGHTGSVLSVAVSPDSAWAASAGDDGIIRIWNLPAGDLLFSLAGHNGKINSLAFDPISQPPELYSAGEDGSLRTWKWLDSTHPPQSSVFTHLHGPARALAFDQQGKMLAAGGDDGPVDRIGAIRMRDPACKGQVVAVVPEPHNTAGPERHRIGHVRDAVLRAVDPRSQRSGSTRYSLWH